MRRLVAVAVLVAGLAACNPYAAPGVPRRVQPFDCQEDEPCWDCTTMGNRICGPRP